MLNAVVLFVGLVAWVAAGVPALANEHGGGGGGAHGGGGGGGGGGEHGGGGGGEGEAKGKKPAKPPKPKRADKDKNCTWGRDVDMEIDGKHLKLTQISLKDVMRGASAEQDGYDFFADPDRLTLKVKTPDGGWYIASMTRLGDVNEGCVFFLVGEARQVSEEPPLF